MADHSNIEWTDSTWAIVTGCSKVSAGCKHCYAETLATTRLKGKKGYPGLPWTPKNAATNVILHPDRLTQPLRWKKPRRIFTTSMGDLFHELVPDSFLDQVFAVMALAPQHTFQILTKRPERMRDYMNRTWGDGYFEPAYDRSDPVLQAMHEFLTDAQADSDEALIPVWPLPNVWLGTSVENARWRTRIDELRATPAAIRFLSCEPLLGPLVGPAFGSLLEVTRGRLNLDGIDWVIIGGESGPGARPMDERWVRDIVDACRRQGAAPFVKQMGRRWGIDHGLGIGHGGNIDTFPADLQIREYPG